MNTPQNTRTKGKGISLPALILLLLVSMNSLKAQQYSSYTQFADNLVSFNPAYALVQGNGAFNALVRKQYAGIAGSPTTLMMNGYLPIASIGSMVGLMVLNDELAVEKLTEINAFFAKSVRLADNQYLGVSLNAGYRFYRANYTSVDPTGMDPNFRDNIDEQKPVIGFGLMYYSDTYYVGLSVPRLTFRSLGDGVEDNNNFRNSYYFSGAYLAKISDDLKVKPAVLVNYTRAVPVTADFSATLYALDKFGIGANYRTTGEVAGMLILNVDAIHIGYSYQFGTGNVAGFDNGTHEITFGVRFGKDAKKPKLL